MRYDRQEPLNIVRDQSVAIIGCGGIGSWAAYYLTLAGVQTLHLFDGDNVSEHNLNRLPLPAGFIGQPKAGALATFLPQFNQEVRFRPHGPFDKNLHDLAYTRLNVTYCLVCTDTWKSRKMVYDACQEQCIPYLEVGAEGNEASLSPSPPEWVMPNEAEPGYQHVPVFVGPCAAIAAMAVYYVLHQQVPTKTFRIGWKDNNLTLNTWEEPDGKEGKQTRKEEGQAPNTPVQPDHQDAG
ncbi:hypothetical protein LCGC14_2582170 [marine sediment metagenome]|uniref:THIF-type NAD/FAD binding fold domain-containing protein n=1 Tax=marine sediment metagenome TaxID=412755 RepID=A0A0F9D6W0_9ZZZZ